MLVGVMLIEAVKLTGKERSLVATGAGADFHDSGLVVGRIARGQKLLKLSFFRFQVFRDSFDVGLGNFAKLRVGR